MKTAAILAFAAVVLVVFFQFVTGAWKLPSVQQQHTSVTRATPRQETSGRTLAAVEPVAERVLPATPADIWRLPSIYRHKYVMLDRWKIGWLGKVPRAQLPDNVARAVPSNCDWFIPLNGAGACMSSAEKAHVLELAKKNRWGLPYADLKCYVERAEFEKGFLLTQCEPVEISMDIEAAREEQERLENQVQSWGQE